MGGVKKKKEKRKMEVGGEGRYKGRRGKVEWRKGEEE